MKMLKVKYKKDILMDIYLDDEDYNEYKDYKLTINKSRGKYFVNAVLRQNLDNCYLHRLIFKCKESDRIGFLDGNRLNLQKSNLFIVNSEANKKATYQLDRERLLEKAKKYYWLNKDKVREYNKKWKKGIRTPRKKIVETLDIVKESRTPLEKILKHKYNYVKNSAKQRGLDFDIDFISYTQIISRGCNYSKIDLLIEESGGSLDRIDNNKGYTIDNVLPCCGWINKMRGNYLTIEETQIAVNAILEHRNKNDKCHANSDVGLTVKPEDT